jgi:hypothetical protein
MLKLKVRTARRYRRDVLYQSRLEFLTGKRGEQSSKDLLIVLLSLHFIDVLD